MPGFVSDGKPIQENDEAYAQAVGNIAPSWEESLGSLWQQGPTAAWMRADARGQNWGSSDLDTALWHVGKMPWEMQDVSTQLTADEANTKYAPPGTTITDKPVDEDLAKVLGEQKRQQIERNSVLARYQANTSWPTQLGMGLAATLLDPINLATTFIPGVGEESILARLGLESIGAKLVARGVSGFTAGAASQAPVVALKYGFSQEEHDDYTLMSAFLDMATAGSLNAAFHAGFGAIGDALKPHDVRASNPVVDAAPNTRYAATSAGVSQMLDGRELNVAPIFDEASTANAAALRPRLLGSAAEYGGERGALRDYLNEGTQAEYQARLDAEVREANPELLVHTDELDRRMDQFRGKLQELGKEREDLPAAQAAQSQIDTILGKVNGVRARLTQVAAQRLGDVEAELHNALNTDTPDMAALRQQLQDADIERRALGPQMYAAYQETSARISGPKVFNPSDLAAEQTALYRNGFARGLPQTEFNQVAADMYGEGGVKPPTPEQPAPTQPTTPGTRPQTPAQQQLADLEARWAGVEEHTPLTQAEQDEIDVSKRGVATAHSRADALDQAASCLREAGI